MGIKNCNVEDAWNNFLNNEGEAFNTVRGLDFTYKVSPDKKGFVTSRADFFLTKANFEKAFNLFPVDSAKN